MMAARHVARDRWCQVPGAVGQGWRAGGGPERRDSWLLTCMCMHLTIPRMRTTVEIPDDLRAKLLDLAARRGEKGFSRLVQEALVHYLDEMERRERLAKDARAVIGSLSDEEAEALEQSVRAARRSWR